MLSGRGLCDGLITRPEESYRLWCVVEVYSRNLAIDEALGHWGLSRHKQTNKPLFLKIPFKFLQRVQINIQSFCDVAPCKPVNSCLSEPEENGTVFLRKDGDSWHVRFLMTYIFSSRAVVWMARPAFRICRLPCPALPNTTTPYWWRTVVVWQLSAGLPNIWHACHFGHAAFTEVPFFKFILRDQRPYIV